MITKLLALFAWLRKLGVFTCKSPEISGYAWGSGIKLLRTGPTTAIVLEDHEVFGVVIPEGYVTDGASVPRAFYNIIARFTDALPAALVHDLRYDPMPDENGVRQRVKTRLQADVEFLANLQACGVSRPRRLLAFFAVVLFGGKPWNLGTQQGTRNP